MLLNINTFLRLLCRYNRNYKNESKSLFSVKLKDGLIFINSGKTKISFVIEHNDRLWQSLCCRMVQKNFVQLTQLSAYTTL